MKHRSLKEPLARLSIVCLALIVSHETFQLKQGSTEARPRIPATTSASSIPEQRTPVRFGVSSDDKALALVR
jgi:hypothetical protein